MDSATRAASRGPRVEAAKPGAAAAVRAAASLDGIVGPAGVDAAERAVAPVAGAPIDRRLRRTAARSTRSASRTFYLASLLLSPAVRADVQGLYLVLRTLDDAVDEGHRDVDGLLGAVERWARTSDGPRTDDGSTGAREVALLRSLDARHRLPRESVLAVCAGLRGDLDFRSPRSVEEFDRYCYCVAGAVGELMTAVLGTVGPREQALPDARALGVAMQRTNVLRDIDEDRLRRARVYLPVELLDRHGGGLDPRDPARVALVRDVAARAEQEYRQGLAAVGRLAHGRAAVLAAGTTYREILRELERAGWATDRRAVVPTRRRAVLLGRALRAG